MNEFELIRQYFARQPVVRADVVVPIGDDGAVLDVPADQQLVVSTDTLNAGVHFPADADALDIGHKSLAVNLSDLAAMGAAPAWFTLNLSLPRVDTSWLDGFCRGLFALAQEHQVQLVGGDTTRGPLSISIAIYGFVPRGQALLRSGAGVGDLVYVTGELGDAALGLLQHDGKLQLPEAQRAQVLQRLHRPTPRVREALSLRGLATACIDISDGLIADLGHILEASKVGAQIDLARLPLSAIYRQQRPSLGWQWALGHGDDYELCFTLPLQRRDVLRHVTQAFACGFTCIGVIEAPSGLRCTDDAGEPYHPAAAGYEHFRVS
jgi:thiamine-monophosphate kinase